MSDIEFREFNKIARLNREVIVTEKIDGTNGLVHVAEDGTVRAGSRSRWITPEDDNFNFAKWVAENADELRGLGPGYHYGEWWGLGIQRTYGLDERRFSLFNVGRWGDVREAKCTKCHLPATTWAPEVCTRCKTLRAPEPPKRPACCHVVPIVDRGVGSAVAANAIEILRGRGSIAAPGFMKPEGVVVFHTASGHLYKVTVEKDEDPKGKGSVTTEPSTEPKR